MARVLIIDDSRLSVSALKSMLADMGHQILEVAHTGEEGVEKAKKHNPDVVCLDYVMPGINGRETALKLQKEVPNAKIVMVTKNPVDKDIKNEIRATHYIVKPITNEKLDKAFAKV